MENKIKVSVIMPVYNSGNYLKTAVDSILSQSLREIELILVDDGSIDGSSERCDEYAKQDSRVVVIHQKNGGICNARNAALKIARGEYIGFSDHDDEYVQGYLETAYEQAIHYKADFVKVGKKEYILYLENLIRTKQSCLPNKVYNKDDICEEYFDLVDSDELDCVWDGLYKKSIIEKNALFFDTTFKHGGEDINFNQNYLPYVNTFVTIGQIFYKHFIREGFSTSAKFNFDKVLVKDYLMESMIKCMSRIGVDVYNKKKEYTYQLLRQYIAPLCALYANPQCKMSIVDKVKAICSLKKKNFFLDFCNKQSAFSYLNKSKKYALLYFLFKYGLYKSILYLYIFYLCTWNQTSKNG